MPHDAALTRIRAEYLEMPGLSLTLEQAQRFLGLERALCRKVLDALVDEQFLCVSPNGVYSRIADGQLLPRRATEADLRSAARLVKAS
jgi:hypothetical protein